jgi:hypothetical protein
MPNPQPRNLIFWGAGATAELGIRTTAEQAAFVRKLVGVGEATLERRVADALLNRVNDTSQWRAALYDLLAILGDAKKCFTRIDHIDDCALDAMRRNWSLNPDEDDDRLRDRIVGLRLFYDWPALKEIVKICPANGTDAFRLNDLFNIIDMHLNFGVRSTILDSDGKSIFLDSRRLVGARKSLNLILIALFHIDYQACLASPNNLLRQYYEFAVQIGRRMQQEALRLADEGCQLDVPEFYQGDLGFVSLNYDPIGLWVQFIANRHLNQNCQPPHIGSPAVPLHIYHDFGHLIPARGIKREAAEHPWYPLNEAAAQRLNEARYTSGYRVRLTKFLFPHGCLCWRECPDCGKLSAYHGHTWDLYARDLFPPPPLRAFDSSCPPWIEGEERERRESGMVDARACLHCETMTYAHHTQIVPQSSFKSRPPSFIDEIQRELHATTMRAEHILLMGYSLPPDDVEYRAFFAVRRQRKGDVRCTIVNKDNDNPGWYSPNRLDIVMSSNNENVKATIKAAKDIFGKENVRFYGGGIPDVFTDETRRVTDRKLEELLDWNSTGVG